MNRQAYIVKITETLQEHPILINNEMKAITKGSLENLNVSELELIFNTLTERKPSNFELPFHGPNNKGFGHLGNTNYKKQILENLGLGSIQPTRIPYTVVTAIGNYLNKK